MSDLGPKLAGRQCRTRDRTDGSLVKVGVRRLAVLVAMIHVLRVGAGVRKPLAALPTLKRLFTGMKTQVLGQVVLVFESLRTDVTVKRTGACQHRQETGYNSTQLME